MLRSQLNLSSARLVTLLISSGASGPTVATIILLIAALVVSARPAMAEPITIKDRHGNTAVVEQGAGSKVRVKSDSSPVQRNGAQPADPRNSESYGEENDLGTTGDQDDLDLLRGEDREQVFEDDNGNVAEIEQDDAPPATFGPLPID
jgi:hypothetical protein